MTANPRIARSTWTGFLPPRSLAMGRLRSGARITEGEIEVVTGHPGCARGKLSNAPQSIVLGEGNLVAELVFVGMDVGPREPLESPQVRPFVGREGELLDKMIEAMGLKREQVYLMNVVQQLPPDGSASEPEEVTAHSSLLFKQLEQLRPKVIVTLGEQAAQAFLAQESPLSELRGQFQTFQSARLMPTFHPADLLRNPQSKREAWSDLQQVARELGIQLPSKTDKKA